MDKRLTILLTALLILPLPISAQDSSAGAAMPFTIISHNPASEAMAGAGILSTRTTAYSATDNAAAASLSDNRGDIALSWHSWSPSNTDFISAGAAFKPADRLGLSASFTSGKNGSISLTDENGGSAGEFTPSQFAAGVGISWRFTDWMSAGASFLLAGENIAPAQKVSASCAGITLMAAHNGLKGLISARNIGGKVQGSDGSTYSLPSNMTIALSYGRSFGAHNLEGCLRNDIYLSGTEEPFTLSLGGEYTFKEMVFARAGYHFGGTHSMMPSYASAGLGFSLSGLHVDVSCMFAGGESPLNDTLALGIGYRF